MGLLTELFESCEALVERWRAEADDRERDLPRALPGEREREEVVIRELRRCADDLAVVIGADG